MSTMMLVLEKQTSVRAHLRLAALFGVAGAISVVLLWPLFAG
jgi:hypothetical protein